MPTSFARPRYIGYAAIAPARSPYTSGKRGSSGSSSKPRSSTMLAGAASASRRRASSTNALTSSAVRAAAGVAGQRVEIRQAGRLQLRAAGLRPRQAAEPVQRKQHDLGRVGNDERPDQVEHGAPKGSARLLPDTRRP